ncbi:MAG: putative transposase [Gammaproteobacteria bacterium]|jgi:putative transposase
MVDKAEPLSVTKQCALLNSPGSTFYHTPQLVSGEDFDVMALIDRCHLKYPF